MMNEYTERQLKSRSFLQECLVATIVEAQTIVERMEPLNESEEQARDRTVSRLDTLTTAIRHPTRNTVPWATAMATVIHLVGHEVDHEVRERLLVRPLLSIGSAPPGESLGTWTTRWLTDANAALISHLRTRGGAYQ